MQILILTFTAIKLELIAKWFRNRLSGPVIFRRSLHSLFRRKYVTTISRALEISNKWRFVLSAYYIYIIISIHSHTGALCDDHLTFQWISWMTTGSWFPLNPINLVLISSNFFLFIFLSYAVNHVVCSQRKIL